MSDYGDELSDYGDDWLYVEEEYMVADDLAEHAVQSPPPTTFDNDDSLEEWDRFEYFLDIEYASDGYDDAKFEPKSGTGDSKIGKKRKRAPTTTSRTRKKHMPVKSPAVGQDEMDMLVNSPVVWRSQEERDVRPKVWEENAESYALMKDWREKLTDTSQRARQSSHAASPALNASHIDIEDDGEDDGKEDEEGGAELNPSAILAVLQERLAAEGGPLSGMNPEQILQFAMRMANGEDTGDDVAGEMADEMLDKLMGEGEGDEGDEDDGETEANLLSWVAQQRSSGAVNGDSTGLAPAPQSSERIRGTKRPLTPPTSDPTRSVLYNNNAMEDTVPDAPDAAASTKDASQEAGNGTRKRKAVDTAEADSSKSASKSVRRGLTKRPLHTARQEPPLPDQRRVDAAGADSDHFWSRIDVP